MNNHPDVPANSGNPDGPSAPTSTARGRRARKRGSGEGTIFKRGDGRHTAGIFVTRPGGTRGRKWIYARTRAEVAAPIDGSAPTSDQQARLSSSDRTRSPDRAVSDRDQQPQSAPHGRSTRCVASQS